MKIHQYLIIAFASIISMVSLNAYSHSQHAVVYFTVNNDTTDYIIRYDEGGIFTTHGDIDPGRNHTKYEFFGMPNSIHLYYKAVNGGEDFTEIKNCVEKGYIASVAITVKQQEKAGTFSCHAQTS